MTRAMPALLLLVALLHAALPLVEAFVPPRRPSSLVTTGSGNIIVHRSMSKHDAIRHRRSSKIFMTMQSFDDHMTDHQDERQEENSKLQGDDYTGFYHGDAVVTARQARILAPLSSAAAAAAIYSSAIFSSAPPARAAATSSSASSTSASTATSASPEIPSFYSTLRTYYPNARPSTALSDRVLTTLIGRGNYHAGNVLLGSSLCPSGSSSTGSGAGGKGSESNEVYIKLSASLGQGDGGSAPPPPKSVTNLAGLAGIPFAGPSGFDAFFSCCPPNGGRVVIVYGPSVGISEGGIMGDATGVQGGGKGGGGGGRDGDCRNAIVEAYNILRGEELAAKRGGEVLASPPPTGRGLRDIQQAYLVKELRNRLPNVDFAAAASPASAAEDDDPELQNEIFAKVVYATYDIISDLLLKEVDDVVQSKKMTFWDNVGEVTMLGGITISATGSRANYGQYFKPIIFQCMRKTPGQTFVVTDNLLDALTAKKDAVAGAATTRKKKADKPAAKVKAPAARAPAAVDVSDDSIASAAVAFGGAAVVGGAIAALGGAGGGGGGGGDEKGKLSAQSQSSEREKLFFGTTVRLPDKSAPDGVPKIMNWRRNANDGSISGNIYGSPSYPDGEYITTSRITDTPFSGAVVETTSGSKYYLGPRPEPGNTLALGGGGEKRPTRSLKSSAPVQEAARAPAAVSKAAPATKPRPPPQKPKEKQKSVFSLNTDGWFGRRVQQKQEPPAEATQPPKATSASLVMSLLQTAAASNRGQFASPEQKGNVASIITELEAMSPIRSPTETAKIEGTWELAYTDTNLVLSSPFFLARRAVCSNAGDPVEFNIALKKLETVVPIGTIGKVRQIVSQATLVSEIDLVSESALSSIVSEANIRPTLSGKAWDISLSSASVRGSNVPTVRRQLKDFQTGATLPGGMVVPGTRVLVETTYLDDALRISRDEDGNVFVFEKVSGSTAPTDYSRISAVDVVLKLL